MNKIDFAYFMEEYFSEEGVKARGGKSAGERVNDAENRAYDKYKNAPSGKSGPALKAAIKIGGMKIRANFTKPDVNGEPRGEDYKRKWK